MGRDPNRKAKETPNRGKSPDFGKAAFESAGQLSRKKPERNRTFPPGKQMWRVGVQHKRIGQTRESGKPEPSKVPVS